MTNKSIRFQRILGVRFLIGHADDVVEVVSECGGLVVVPSGPGLSRLPYDGGYRAALLGADFAICDSAYMVFLWNLIQHDDIPKLSGLKYVHSLIGSEKLRLPKASFWVMPSKASASRNIDWLVGKGIEVTEKDTYLAPAYDGSISDPELLGVLEKHQPPHIVLAIGGGIQEKLGLYLRQNLSYKPTIHCIGAAIAFLSGDQVRIPAWVDSLGMGWLLRCLSDPKQFIPRYWGARGLGVLIIRYRDRLPPFES
jgi:hypothetical protein